MTNANFNKLILLFATIMPTVFGGVLEDGEILFTELLNAYNQLDGIELLGGPFKVNQYDIEFANQDKESQFIEYKYAKTHVQGWPFNLTVGIYGGIHFPLSISESPVSFSEAIRDDLCRNAINPDDLPSLKEFHCESSMTIVEVDRGGKILRMDENVPSINRIVKQIEGSVLVYYNETYNSSFFHNALNTRSFVSYNIANNSHEEEPNETTDGLLNSRRFILFGTVSDKSLRSLIERHCQAHPGFEILAVRVTSENKAFLYEGNLDLVTKWLVSKPKAIAMLDKNVNWRVSKTIAIVNMDEYCFDVPVHIFPFTSMLNDQQLSEITTNMILNTSLNETDATQLIHYVCRFRGISNNVVSMKDIGSLAVEIRVGELYKGTAIQFKKIGDRWIVSGYYEYVS